MKRRDPFVTSIAVVVLIVATGLAAIALGWRGVASATGLSVQLPYLVSGVFGGVALVGFGLGLLAIQSTRRQESADRDEFNRLVVAAADVLAAARHRGGAA